MFTRAFSFVQNLFSWKEFPKVLLGLYLLTRLFIWVFRPMEFSEIIYSYMPYAHYWASGETPYRKHFYEYPPATIPLFYVPHMIDMSTHGTPFHSDYLHSYRAELLLTDMLVFFLIWKVLRKQKVNDTIFSLGVLYYILLTTKAHHFIYDTMDLTFAAGIIISVAVPIIFASSANQANQTKYFSFAGAVSWMGFFLAVALKYVNAPLAPVYAFLERQNWKWLLLNSFLGFIIIWGVPLVLYRSALSVTFVFHSVRGIQIDSAPAIILRTINSFTKTEKVIEIYKNYEIAGPYTDVAKNIVKYSFPLAIGLFILFGIWLARKNRAKNPDFLRLHLTIGYVFVFMLTGKVLSTPFLLWHIPLLALYPYRDVKHQLKYFIPSIILIYASMTRVSNDYLWVFPYPLIMGWIRTLCFLFLFTLWVKDSFSFGEKKAVVLASRANKKSR